MIAERMGRHPEVLQKTMYKPPKDPIDQREARRERLAAAFAAGAKITDIAYAVGLKQQTIIKSLELSGFDREMRELVRARQSKAP